MEDLQHYSIALNSTAFQIWLTKYERGKYVVRLLDAGLLYNAGGVEQYVKWWNAIHMWGLGPNAQSFKRDVEALWEKNKKNASTAAMTPPVSENQAAPAPIPPSTEA
ncbi:hypothetical protein MMC27_007140 [Xylographa pallens]|nr:hypothetical protein [Xylographa pallens]